MELDGTALISGGGVGVWRSQRATLLGWVCGWNHAHLPVHSFCIIAIVIIHPTQPTFD
jgi:hypothetical protein